MSADAGRRRRAAQSVSLGLALVAVTWLVFAGACDLGSVEYDDPDYVTRNPHVQAGLTAEGIRWALTSSFAANWFPLTWMSHMLDYELFGDDLGRFHGTSVALHVLNTLLLFGLLLRTTGKALRAAMVAALFALHPLHVESVVWLSERKGLLSSAFALVACHAYVGYARRPSALRMLGVAAAFACGLASKPMVVTLPFVLLLLDFWPLARVDLETLRRPGASLARRLRASGIGGLVVEKGALFALTAAGIAVTLSVQDVAVVGIDSLPPLQRAASVGTAYARYLALLLWPVGLTPIHLHPGPAIALAPGLVGLAGVVALTAAAVAALRAVPVLAVGWLWFAGMLVPVIGIVQVGGAIVAERYTYLPLIGPFIAVVWGVADGLGRRTAGRALAGGLAVAALVACAIVSRARVPDWRDTITLFSRAVELDPANHVAHTILGLGYARSHDDDRAIEHYRRAAELHPGGLGALQRIARRMMRSGDPVRAERALRFELELAPGMVPARNDLAHALLAQGRRDEARAELEQVLRLRPDNAVANEQLGRLLLAEGGDPLRARSHLERAIAAAPEAVSARLALARLLWQMGEREAAIHELEGARARAPDDPGVRSLEQVLRAGGGP